MANCCSREDREGGGDGNILEIYVGAMMMTCSSLRIVTFDRPALFGFVCEEFITLHRNFCNFRELFGDKIELIIPFLLSHVVAWGKILPIDGMHVVMATV